MTGRRFGAMVDVVAASGGICYARGEGARVR